VWNRSCPRCFVKLPRTSVLANSARLVCPSCHSVLELSRPSRVFAAMVGVIAAYLAVELTALIVPNVAWIVEIVAAVLAYGSVSAMLLYFLSDLVLEPGESYTPFPHSRR
jgi:hypothetical protein